MESFAAVVRTLLHRIRAVQDAYPPGPWPPTAGAVNDRARGPLYRVRPTAWGVAAPEAPRPARPAPVSEAERGGGRGSAGRGLELRVYGLPVPRGLPST